MIPTELIDRMARAQSVTVLTGSGISAASGIPTFRGADGLWKQHRAEDLATPQAFRRDPELVWEWYRYRRTLIRRAAPNAGHLALVELEQLVPELTILTQNVDGLHQRAGSTRVVELHGNIFINRCVGCGKEIDVFDNEDDDEGLPRCSCGELFRPGVVWFEEPLPQEALALADEAATQCDVFLSVGTSGVVYPAAGYPLLAKSKNAFVVEINPEQTALSKDMHLIIQASAAEALPELVNRLKVVKHAK